MVLFEVHHTRGSVRLRTLAARGNAARDAEQFSPSSCSLIAVLSGLVFPTYELMYLSSSLIVGGMTSSP